MTPARGTEGTAPALYEATVHHARAEPVRHAFAHRTHYWLIDLDAPPRLPWPLRALAGFHPADHGDGRAATLRSDIDSYLREHGIDLAGGRVLMLAHARVFGYVFNPLTVYWCHGPDGSPRAVVAEVHNTYGDRHRYLLHPDGRGRAAVAKALYVSPFNEVDGEYRLSLPEPGERLALSVALHREGRPPFTASVRGRRRPATVPELLRLSLRQPLAPLVNAARIRFHGVWLYLRGLPVKERPEPPRPQARGCPSASAKHTPPAAPVTPT
ncbi:DUF1365 domain-containing protein [Nocardiopsis metallicus]|uniref:DUF1365 domain-containing protein n=1 Tax=Nocardiopsis metallicus TaxID=179819 RepID=A0A840W0D8_9ACTN|nr:DUF1365 domain-containing protein [Nocardiopsis metallicus]MBB5489434.1 hypothetical protein [Nocardiopsis metallicus]